MSRAGIHRVKFARCRRVPRSGPANCAGPAPVQIEKATAERLRLFCLGLGRRGGFRSCHEGRECRGVLYRNIREHFAVESDARCFQAVHQLADGQTVQAGGSADALNPQAAVLALLDAAVALGVAIGAIRSFLGGLVELALGEEKAFCPLEVLLAPCTALGAAFYASHGVSPLRWETKRVAGARKKHASRNGFVSGMNCLAAFEVHLAANT